MSEANKIFKLDKRGFARRARKMRWVISLIMLTGFAVAMLVLNLMEGSDDGLPLLTMVIISIFLGLVYYFINNWINTRLTRVLQGFGLELAPNELLLRQYGAEEMRVKRSEIEGIGQNASGGYAIILKKDQGTIPIPEELAEKETALKEIQKWLGK
ncbi:MAG: hypothetical protein H6581_02915 [Bacteroidia bacterium]|nr:hypothetical protein [Bacteroidia bacterium]